MHGEDGSRRGRDDTRRRIVYVIDDLSVGGAERHLVRLVTRLAGSERWRPSVYCLSRSGPLTDELEAAGVDVVGPSRLWSRSPPQVVATLWALVRYLREVRPHITHSYMPQAGLLGAVASRLAGVPAVITTRRWVHDFHGAELLEYRLACALMDRCSDAVIAVCEAARQQAIAEGTPAEKIETIYNSVEAQPAPDRSTRLFAGSPVIGTVGRMDSYKGQAYLIGALPVVLIEFPDARFVLIGDGPERECLQSSAERLGVGDRVSFLGTRSDVSVLMSQLDLFVLPSLLEGFPNAVLEAMAARLPIVATRVGGVPELIEDGRTGLLVEPGSAQALAEAIIRIWTDHDLRRGCATAAHEAVRTKYCPQREAEDTEAVYLRLLAERCGHARQGVAVR